MVSNIIAASDFNFDTVWCATFTALACFSSFSHCSSCSWSLVHQLSRSLSPSQSTVTILFFSFTFTTVSLDHSGLLSECGTLSLGLSNFFVSSRTRLPDGDLKSCSFTALGCFSGFVCSSPPGLVSSNPSSSCIADVPRVLRIAAFSSA